MRQKLLSLLQKVFSTEYKTGQWILQESARLAEEGNTQTISSKIGDAKAKFMGESSSAAQSRTIKMMSNDMMEQSEETENLFKAFILSASKGHWDINSYNTLYICNVLINAGICFGADSDAVQANELSIKEQASEIYLDFISKVEMKKKEEKTCWLRDDILTSEDAATLIVSFLGLSTINKSDVKDKDFHFISSFFNQKEQTVFPDAILALKKAIIIKAAKDAIEEHKRGWLGSSSNDEQKYKQVREIIKKVEAATTNAQLARYVLRLMFLGHWNTRGYVTSPSYNTCFVSILTKLVAELFGYEKLAKDAINPSIGMLVAQDIYKEFQLLHMSHVQMTLQPSDGKYYLDNIRKDWQKEHQQAEKRKLIERKSSSTSTLPAKTNQTQQSSSSSSSSQTNSLPPVTQQTPTPMMNTQQNSQLATASNVGVANDSEVTGSPVFDHQSKQNKEKEKELNS
ncbi:hypothetical protein L3V79_00350 [Thiotrichales bacterium 19S9-12]|nr:hypothetical protein [Thiotrichales bacterium 19S9-11]MCF6810817.1 hypothetical protein [Thiotrichales bacterium 19S9-12]